MGMIGYAKAGGEMARVFRLLTAAVGMLAIVSVSAAPPTISHRRRASATGTTSTPWS